MSISLILHVLVGAALVWRGRPILGSAEPAPLLLTDIAPGVPEPHDPSLEAAALDERRPSAAPGGGSGREMSEPHAVLEPKPRPAPAPEGKSDPVATSKDGRDGLADPTGAAEASATSRADPSAPDSGLGDPGATAGPDGGVPMVYGGFAADETGESHARPDAAAAPGGATLPPPGANANLLAYLPDGEVITALLRLDRFRDTPWAPYLEEILHPMPDYQALFGARRVPFTQIFESLVISSSEPREVRATTIAARFRHSRAFVRSFVDRSEAPVRWRAGRGGPVGRRAEGRWVAPGDSRLFFMPYDDMVLLAKARDLGRLIEAVEVPLDTTQAAPADTPAWLQRLRVIDEEANPAAVAASGENASFDGPALIVTSGGLLRDARLWGLGTFVAPDRATVAVWFRPEGLIVQGSLLFATPERAVSFVAHTEALRTRAAAQFVLKTFHLDGAALRLALEHQGARVTYSTSLSPAEAHRLLTVSASWSRMFFAPERRRARWRRATPGRQGEPQSTPESNGDAKRTPAAGPPKAGEATPSREL